MCIRDRDTGDIELKEVNFSHLPRLTEFVVPFKWHLSLALVMTIAVSLMGTVGPLLIRRILDIDIPSGSVEQVSRTALLYFAVIAVTEIIRVSQQYMMAWVGHNTVSYTHLARPIQMVVIGIRGNGQMAP